MAENQQQEFLNELLDQNDRVTGIRLTVNKFLILFLKCLYIRKQKKVLTLFELFLPPLIFLFSMSNQNTYFQFKHWRPHSTVSRGDNFRFFGQASENLGSTFYYDYNKTNVDATKLKEFLTDAVKINKTIIKLTPKPLEKITDNDYIAFFFNKFDDKNLDYQIVVADGYNNRSYLDWKLVDLAVSGPFERHDVDEFHESILKKFATNLNPDASKYKLEFAKAEIEDGIKQDQGPDNKPRGPDLYNPAIFQAFTVALVGAYFINGIFVLTSVCEEKRTKSVDFLKLMGATDGQILAGHFLNHMLFWSFSFLICMGILSLILSGFLPFAAVCLLVTFAFLYLAHLVIFLFLLSAPFKRYLYPEILNILLFFVCINSYQEKTYQTGFIGFLKLAHPVNMLFRFQKISMEVLCKKYTFQNENLFKIFFYSDGYEMSLTALFWSTILFIVIEIALTNFIIQVNPFQSGLRKPFFYFLTRQYWVDTQPVTEYKQNEQKEFEQVPSGSRPAIILKNVDKWFRSWFIFGKFQVLKGLDFAIYEKQITVLLGHNGAGKSTAMNLIAGLSTADQGSITVNGIPVSGYNSSFKQELGYCPQENVFYERLTVYENLKIASVLKGISFGSSMRKIRVLTRKFDLPPAMRSSDLSGGMKRRLCLGMAITGYKEVLVIDEPTSGLDPETRRRIWEILLELRKSRTILLTTHFLEEADILGDRIAIMYDGKLRCCGSTLFLKQLYHVGYLLRMQLTDELTDADQLLTFIRQHIPDAFFENQRANETFYRLALSEERAEAGDNLNLMIAKLLDAFEDLEVRQQYQIETFGLTNTTLEDVFIKIGTLEEPKEKAITIETAEDHPLHNLKRLDGFALYAQQLWAIQYKKLKLSYRNLALFWQSIYLVFPIVMLAFALTPALDVIHTQNGEINYDTFSLSKLKDNEVWAVRNTSAGSEGSDLFRKTNLGWLNKTYNLKAFEVSEKTAKKAIEKRTTDYGTKKLREVFAFVPERFEEFGYRVTVNPAKIPYSSVGTMEAFYRLIAMEKNRDFNVNLKFHYYQPLGLGTGTDTETKEYTQVFTIVAFKLVIAIVCAIPIALMFSFPFIAFTELPHEENNSGALSMQIIAGLSKILYWIGNLLFDFLYSFVMVGIACLAVYVFGVDGNILSPHLPVLLLTFTLALLNCLLITYFILNLNFSKEATDSLVKWPLFAVGLALSVYDALATFVYFLLQPQTGQKFRAPGHLFFLVISPVYNVLDTINHLINQKLLEVCTETVESDKCEHLDSRNYNFIFNLVAYLISAIIFGGLIFLANRHADRFQRAADSLKKRFQRKKKDEEKVDPRRASRMNTKYLKDLSDPNVEEEAQVAHMLVETNSMQSNILVVHDLCKQYGALEAVNHLSFTVKRGECFGLLGINGAGKSSCFKMIGGSVIPTSGTIMLDRHTFEKNPYEYYRRLGYCPQENTHTKRITVTDNLLYYASINGVPRRLLNKTVNTLIEECDLQEHRNKFANNLSGGNMRKLSTAISLIGKKDLILLDEMSTGVDPVARRKLWKTIEFYKQELNCSFILTSHSMDEVENLCSTIAIMAAGKFKCLGTFNYLRSKYSQGFTILINIKESSNNEEYLEELKERMDVDFNGRATMKEYYMNTVVYIIMSKAFKWPRLFRTMESIKVDMDLQDFLIEDTNLEKIFLSFVH